MRINSASRAVDEHFIVNRVTFRQFDEGSFLYEVSLVTTKSFDLIDLLIKLALRDTKQVEVKAGEQIDLIESFDETMSFSETFTAQSLNYPAEFCAGTFTAGDNAPQGVKRIFLVEGSPLH